VSAQTVRAAWSQLVPSVAINLFDGLEGEIAAMIERLTTHAAETSVHGARMAGEVLTFDGQERALVRWVLVGNKPDGKNCEDCLALHGQVMTLAAFLDMKFTTRCNGNCRCDKEPVDGESVEPLTQDEIDNAAGEQP